MHKDFEQQTLENKFSFFKKNTERPFKMTLKDKILVSVFVCFMISAQSSSIDKMKTASAEFQQQTFESYTSTPPTKNYVNNNSGQILVEYLVKRDVTYEDLDTSLETIKANKKDLPPYLFTSTLLKVKDDNKLLLSQKIKNLRQDYQSTARYGVSSIFLGREIRRQNWNQYVSGYKTYQSNYHLLEKKISTVALNDTKEVKVSTKVTK